uniref:Protein NRDE2 homolog n=1 Tax=Glossina brevipalpis TaxID=37001 RepID=A0A1A9W4C9_9MUSC
MSLFPAYSEPNDEDKGEVPPLAADFGNTQWLENNSFTIKEQHLKPTKRDSVLSSANDCRQDFPTYSIISSGDSSEESLHEYNRKKTKRSKKSKDGAEKSIPTPTLEFAGNEEFYVDKGKAKQYNTIKTLHKPACPRYKVYRTKPLGMMYTSDNKSKSKRYFQCKETKEEICRTQIYPLEENEYTTQMGQLNRKTMESWRELQPWLDLIELQDRNPYKWSRLRVSEKQLDYIQKALHYHPRNENLYRKYIDIVRATYPSHDVTKMLESLLSKDPYCLTLWEAQIMTTQGTMARCTVPDVLRLYQRCMKKMYASQRPEESASQTTDSVMIHLFHNCAIFLRQAGLYEQFFAVIKLALELNVVNTKNFSGDLQPRPEDELTLVEYEELILQSGLPMNEIWLRIETLRQGFNFLPFPGDGSKCSDPQRIVFNEDVCHYVYPLKSKENSFRLLLIIVKLLKIPFIQTNCLMAQLEGDSDAVEEILAICLKRNYALPIEHNNEHDEFLRGICELSKELAVSPTFLSNTVAHELYSRCLKNFLINCAASYEGVDERKRLTFLLLWCRFERLLLIFENLTKKVTPEFIKNGQSRFKSLLKQKINRNAFHLYVDFALYEIESNSKSETIENIFKNIISSYKQEDNLASELCHVYVTYAEVLIGWGKNEEASQLLSAYSLGLEFDSNAEPLKNPRKLAALKLLHNKLEDNINIEKHVDIMVLEQHLIPDYTISLLKAFTLLQHTLEQKQEALAYLDKLLLIFHKNSKNERHNFLREQIYELYSVLLQIPGGNNNASHTFIMKRIFTALEEYPHNLSLLQKWGTLTSIPWYKLKAGFLKLGPSITSIILLIALARFRYLKPFLFSTNISEFEFVSIPDFQHNETVIRQRILNLFKFLIPSNASTNQGFFVYQNFTTLQRNGLFWRCYLRCLSDQSTSFETSKKCLLTALDECPWSKALYLDGATYVPQELSNLQDLVIEKQLRIYALPEELEILRED